MKHLSDCPGKNIDVRGIWCVSVEEWAAKVAGESSWRVTVPDPWRGITVITVLPKLKGHTDMKPLI